MYPDPKRVRQKLTVYLDQYESDVITALANYLGAPKAEVMRAMLMREAQDVLGVDPTGLAESIAEQSG